MAPNRNIDNFRYGNLLGEYFEVVSTISEMESQFDERELEDREVYNDLLETRENLRKLLDESSRNHIESDIKKALDETFSDR